MDNLFEEILKKYESSYYIQKYNQLKFDENSEFLLFPNINYADEYSKNDDVLINENLNNNKQVNELATIDGTPCSSKCYLNRFKNEVILTFIYI